jgi:hypothetical protein
MQAIFDEFLDADVRENAMPRLEKSYTVTTTVVITERGKGRHLPLPVEVSEKMHDLLKPVREKTGADVNIRMIRVTVD